MGGSKALDRPANIIVLCSVINGLLESDPEWAELGREYGWKLSRAQVPEESPVFYITQGAWRILDNSFEYR